MIFITAMLKGQSKLVELVMDNAGGVFDILTIFERDPTVVQYQVADRTGPIPVLADAFGWTSSWSKHVTFFDWSKLNG